ncbi:MAG: hypothetical protein GW898_08545 [Thiomicrospira sp.]|nr:hypothetical protein [Thiomicrospira sp.]NCO80606.1 hypothetical protein [Thiomicrospira sp.]OIP96645.1 MAG: hypothetical protein AUK56_01395 [Thiomicrospira sp. CG2_30_44_34]
MKYQFGFVLSCVLVMMGCQSSPSKPLSSNHQSESQKSLVAPNDDLRHFYGVGFGMTELEAQNDALSKVATRISTSVESKTQSSLTVVSKNKSETIDRSFQNKINTQSKKIDFANIRVVDKQKFDNGTQILVSVDRQALINSYQNKIESTSLELNHDFKLYQATSAFNKLLSEDALLTKLATLDSYVQIMQVLKPQYNKSAIDKVAQAIYQSIKDHKESVQFKVKNDRQSSAFARLLAEKIAFEGYSVVDSAQVPTSNTITISVTTKVTPFNFKTTNPQYANLIMVDRLTSYQIEDGQGQRKNLYNGAIKTRGISSKSQESAIQDSKPYKKILNKSTIIEFLAQHQ